MHPTNTNYEGQISSNKKYVDKTPYNREPNITKKANKFQEGDIVTTINGEHKNEGLVVIQLLKDDIVLVQSPVNISTLEIKKSNLIHFSEYIKQYCC